MGPPTCRAKRTCTFVCFILKTPQDLLLRIWWVCKRESKRSPWRLLITLSPSSYRHWHISSISSVLCVCPSGFTGGQNTHKHIQTQQQQQRWDALDQIHSRRCSTTTMTNQIETLFFFPKQKITNNFWLCYYCATLQTSITNSPDCNFPIRHKNETRTNN